MKLMKLMNDNYNDHIHHTKHINDHHQIQQEHQRYQHQNELSANTIFAIHNQSSKLEDLLANGQPVDFHGLQVREVEQYMNRIFRYRRSFSGKKKVTIITGRGNHSRNMISPIREYVIKRLQEEGISFTTDHGQVSFSY